MRPAHETPLEAVRASTPSTLDAGLSDSPVVALLPWGDLIEDFLDEIGVSLQEFTASMTGGWLFGYIDALRQRGIRTVLVCFSARVATTLRTVHQPTGAAVLIIPASRPYRALRRTMKDPYGRNSSEMFGVRNGPGRHWWRLAHHVAPYFATPVIALALAVRREGCATILCQEYESPRFDASVLAGTLLRIPVFATFQGGNWQRSKLERLLRPRALRRCAGLIIGSSVEAARVRARYGVGEARLARIFNPLDSSQWRAIPRGEARRDLGIADATRVAIWHGRIDMRRKGLDLLLSAWRDVCSSRPGQDLLLLLVGAGVDAVALAEEIAATSVPRLRWISEYILDKSRIRRYLSAANLYVFPSRHEGFPVAPLEAMACGLPVVAAAASGVTDIFGATDEWGGVVVPTGDAAALGQAMGRLLDDDLLARRLGGLARLRVEQAFGLRAVGGQLQAFLRQSGGLRT